MTVVFVHGNPETAAVWNPLLEQLRQLGRSDTVCLSPPGFGVPLPEGFGATVGEYRDWLIGELEGLDGPIDLVGHDWGGGHVLTAVMARPDLTRSWTSDVLGIFEPEYVWHELAQVWQTPGDGERHLEELFGADRVASMVGLGIPEPVAREMAPYQDGEMARAILALYRSAAQPAMAELGTGLPAAAKVPGLHVVATGDTFVGTFAMRRRASERAGARTEVLEGPGHWWMAEQPARAARVLTAFWNTLS